MLATLLFVIKINDFVENIQSMISMFADDTKVRGIVDCEAGYQRLHQDLDQMGMWAVEWLIEFECR